MIRLPAHRLIPIAALAAFALVVGAVPAFAASTPQPVIHTHYQETEAAGGGGYIFWSTTSQFDRNHYRVLGRKVGSTAPPFGIEAPNKQGFTGALDGTSFIYQQTNRKKTLSDLFFYDLDTKHRTALPAIVNTSSYEYGPSMSGDEITFARLNLNTRVAKIVLWQKGDHTTTTLDTIKGADHVENGSINGNYAVWDRCDPDCNVYEYRVDTGKLTKIGNPQGKSQYGPGVTPDGTVFFARSGIGCGTHVQIVEDPVNGPQKVAVSLPVGIDLSRLNVVVGSDPTAVLFDHYDCAHKQFDIYRFTA
jgi:hypothetical protein